MPSDRRGGDDLSARDLISQLSPPPSQPTAQRQQGLTQADLDQARKEVQDGDLSRAVSRLEPLLSLSLAPGLESTASAIVRASALALLGYVYALTQRPQDSEAASTTAIDLFSRVATGLPSKGQVDYGFALLRLGRPADAIAPLQQAIEMGDTTDGYLGLAQAYEGLQQLELAVSSYQEASLASLSSNRADDALELINRAIPLQTPPSGRTRAIESAAQWVLGNREQARAALEEAITSAPDDPLTLNVRAQVALADEKYHDALEALDKLIPLYPEWPVPLYMKGQALAGLGDLEKARSELEHACALAPDFSRAWVALGDVLQLLQEHRKALEAFDRALQLEPTSASTVAKRGAMLMELGEFADAEAELQKAVRLAPEEAFSHGQLAELYRREERYEEALSEISRSTDLSPDYAWARGTRGQILAALGRSDQAIADLTLAVTQDPTLAWAREDLIKALESSGRYAEALEVAEGGFKVGNAVAFREAKARILMAMKRYSDAESVLAEIVKDDPKRAWSQAVYAEALRMDGKFDEALEAINAAIALDEDPWSLGTKGQILAARGDVDEAIACFQEALAKAQARPPGDHKADQVDETLDPNLVWILNDMATTYLLADRYEQAIDAYNRVLAKQPENQPALVNRSDALRLAGQVEEALRDADEAVRLDAGDVRGFAARAEALRQLGRLEEAVEAADRALVVDPTYTYVMVSKAYSLLTLERLTEGLAAVDAALTLEPDYAWALGCAGALHFEAGEYDVAIQSLRKAIEADPSDLFVLGQFGLALLEHDRAHAAEARDAFLRILNAEPDTVLWLMNVGETYRLDGADEASSWYHKALAVYEERPVPDADTLAVLAWCHMRLHALDEATSMVVQAMSLQPENAPHRFDLGLIQMLSGRLVAGEADYDRAIQVVATKSDPRRRYGLLTVALHYLREATEENPTLSASKEASAAMERLTEAREDTARSLAGKGGNGPIAARRSKISTVHPA